MELPLDRENIAEIMRDLGKQPEWQNAAHRNSTVQMLSDHDWADPLEYVRNLAKVAYTTTPERNEKLKQFATFVAQAPIHP